MTLEKCLHRYLRIGTARKNYLREIIGMHLLYEGKFLTFHKILCTYGKNNITLLALDHVTYSFYERENFAIKNVMDNTFVPRVFPDVFPDVQIQNRVAATRFNT